MTYDEAQAFLTNELCGRTIAHVERVDKEIVLVTTCGHAIVLKSDLNHDIHYVRTDVRISLTGSPIFGRAGKL